MAPLSIVTVNATVRDLADVAVRRAGRDVTAGEIQQSWFGSFVSDMFETLYSTPGGIGLAAPQVGVLLRVAVIDLHDSSAPLVLVNPAYQPDGEETDLADERCLSVPDFAAPVRRYLRIRVRYRDQRGSEHDAVVTDFPARVMQHEIDHLDGVLCIDRVADKSDIRAEMGGYPARHARRTLEQMSAER